jgi:pimeloyl-ACP methyl ester carboxylesterase
MSSTNHALGPKEPLASFGFDSEGVVTSLSLLAFALTRFGSFPYYLGEGGTVVRLHAMVPKGLRSITPAPFADLALYEHRVAHPRATIICLHGGLDRATSFSRLARRLHDIDLLAYDRRGYQGSRDRTPISLEGHIEDLISVAQRERARDVPLIFFGHSYGGLVATGAAIKAPGLASCLLNYETPYPWVLARPGARMEMSDDPEEEVEIFFRRVVSDEAWNRLSNNDRTERYLDAPGLLSDLGLLTSRSAPYDLTQLAQPLHYVYGDSPLSDFYASLSAALHDVNDRINSLVVANADHGIHLSRPDGLAKVITDIWEQTCELA